MTWMKGIALVAMSGLTLGALTMGCSSTPDESTPVDPLATEEGFCAALAEVVCAADVVDACYGSIDSSREADTQSCVEKATASFCNSEMAVYRADNAQGCINAYKAAYADAAIAAAEQQKIDDACHATLSGNGVEGDTCEINSDCNGASSLHCVVKPGGTGTCQIPEEVAPGLDCAGANQTCEDGFYCSMEAGACIARQSVGEPCAEAQPCDSESICADGVCAAKIGNGETCTLNEECEGGVCDKTEGSIDGRCRTSLPIAVANGECNNLLP